MIDLIIDERERDLGGGFVVGRVLPFAKRRMVGPFIFFDHMGPMEFARGIPKSLDVRPHPHIGISTVTYLFEGEIMHRDSVGTELAIQPGEVNWMTAGSGITHSERFEKARALGDMLHGIQAWVALPDGMEEIDAPRMVVFGKGDAPVLKALTPAKVMLLGGDPVGERFIDWNFVSSSKERIAEAQADWRAQRMKLPDLDDQEFTPLPE